MDWNNDLNWFAIQTKPRQESLAAAHVAKLDLEVFLPKFRHEQAGCGTPRHVTKPLFPGYFFTKFIPLFSHDNVRFSPGVLRVVGNRQSPIPVEPEIISSIQERIQPDGFIRLQPRRFQPGEKVKIDQGPFAGWMAEVEREWDDGKRVAILLGTLQQARLLIQGPWLVSVEAS